MTILLVQDHSPGRRTHAAKYAGEPRVYGNAAVVSAIRMFFELRWLVVTPGTRVLITERTDVGLTRIEWQGHLGSALVHDEHLEEDAA